MSTERFTDDLRPELVAEASTYARTPEGPVLRAPLSSAGIPLGWVWSDGSSAAGWTPGEATPAAARAGAYVWRVLRIAHARGEPASTALDPSRYSPLYELGDPVT